MSQILNANCFCECLLFVFKFFVIYLKSRHKWPNQKKKKLLRKLYSVLIESFIPVTVIFEKKKTSYIFVFYNIRLTFSISRYYIVRQTDRRTDKQTDMPRCIPNLYLSEYLYTFWGFWRLLLHVIKLLKKKLNFHTL